MEPGSAVSAIALRSELFPDAAAEEAEEVLNLGEQSERPGELSALGAPFPPVRPGARRSRPRRSPPARHATAQ